MKKIKLLLLILISCVAFGQDSVMVDSVTAPKVLEEEYLGEYAPEYETPAKEEREETEFHNREFKEEFKDDYKGEEFNYDRKTKEQTYSPPLFQLPGGLLQFLMYGVLGIIIVLIIIFIIKNAGGIYFGKEKNKIKYDTSDESGEEDLEQIGNNNFELLIQKAKSEGDYRKAVRYYYLWVLQKLTDRNLIKWDKDKTDHDYLLELKNHTIKEDFSTNTYIYDYTWYGKFELNSNEFQLAESIFQRTLKKIN